MLRGTTLLYSCLLAVAADVTTISTVPCKEQPVENGSERDAFDKLTDPCHYDKHTRPHLDTRTTVYVHMHVYSIGSIDSQNLRFTAQIIIRYRWNDPRLQQDSYLEYGVEMVDKIWVPHVYIVNEQESKVMGSARKDIMNLIRPDGTVILCTRMKVTLECVMDLQKFPFDKQLCPLIMESWSFNASQLELVWEEEEPLTIDINLHLAEYSLVDVLLNETVTQYGHTSGRDNNDYFKVYYAKAAGNFSTLTIHFDLSRRFGYYIMDYYVPSVMIVVLSWVTFWLDANSTPGRTTIGTSTLLTFITLSRNLDNSLPKVSYIKASEIWFIGCTAFIFFSVAEFTFVNIIWRRKRNVTLKKVTSRHILQSTLTPHMYREQIKMSQSIYRRNVTLKKVTSRHILQSTLTPHMYREQINMSQSKSLPSISTMTDSPYISEHRGSCGQITLSLDFKSQMAGLQSDLKTISIPVTYQQEEQVAKTLLTMTPQEIANWIDRRSRIYFPLAFFIFNCCYWTWTILF